MKKPFLFALMVLALATAYIVDVSALTDESVLSGSLDLQAVIKTADIPAQAVFAVQAAPRLSGTIYVSQAVFAPPGSFYQETSTKATMATQTTMTGSANAYLFAAVIILLATAAAMIRKKDGTRRSRDGLERGFSTFLNGTLAGIRKDGAFALRATA